MKATAISSPQGGVAAAHPRAVRAGLSILASGGGAVDAAIAAQAVLCVVAPQAAGLGGDSMTLVCHAGAGPFRHGTLPHGEVSADGLVSAVGEVSAQRVVSAERKVSAEREVLAVGGSGPWALDATVAANDAGASVTVPGMVDAWDVLSQRWGRLTLADCLAPAVDLAAGGFVVDGILAGAAKAQRERLVRGGAQDWPLLHTPVGGFWKQPELAAALDDIGRGGAGAFYTGPMADAIVAADRADGGVLSSRDLASLPATLGAPVSTAWDGGTAHVQPPPSQGVLLAMALRWLASSGSEVTPHLLVELIEGAFAWRDHAAKGSALLEEAIEVDQHRAARRGGPRPYLHTAGVAACDEGGAVVSSLVSVFDDFGSATFVPEGGFVLNNRAGGFTSAPNDAAGGKRPVHTLAPMVLCRGDGDVLGLSTPGADGQVQTLLQVLAALQRTHDERGPSDVGHLDVADVAAAVAAPRWRSEGRRLLVEASHPERGALADAGHHLDLRADGEEVFGAVVAAGVRDGVPFVAADWRRQTAAGAL